jgi:CRP/FNR family transcriptional regulator, anaerobic regulatory protein
MTTEILKSVKLIVSLNHAEEDAFLKILEKKKFNKKDFLLKEGQISDKIFFINQGCLRLFYAVDSNENTVQFLFSSNWHIDYASFLTGKPSIENLQALESCEVIQIRKTDLYSLYNRFPVFERLFRVMAENAFMNLSKINKMLINQEPEQRYQELIIQSPELFDRIPQYYIASYLGVKPETFSRIRKRVSVHQELMS